MSKTVEEIAEELRGTPTFISTVLEKYEMEHLEDDIEWCLSLDDLVFCCEVCDWWHTLSECADSGRSQGICEECFNEGESDD